MGRYETLGEDFTVPDALAHPQEANRANPMSVAIRIVLNDLSIVFVHLCLQHR